MEKRICAVANNKKQRAYLHSLFEKKILFLNLYDDTLLKKNKFIYKLNLFLWYYFLINHLFQLKQKIKYSYKIQILNPFWRGVIVMLVKLKTSKIFTFLDKSFFDCHPYFIKYLKQNKPLALIIPGSAMDTNSYLGIRSARKLRIPSIMATTHWDYFSKKGILRAIPDYLMVWGNSMAKAAIRQGFPSTRIFSVGFPLFDNEKKSLKSFRIRAPKEKQPTVFFAGAALPFDELSALKLIQGYLAVSVRKIIYRPHPRAKVCPVKMFRVNLHSPLVHVAKPAPFENEHVATRNILRKSHGLITPASTMLLEAGCFGLPSLCLIYNDGINDHLFPFSYAAESEHIKSIQNNPYIIFCHQKQDLPKKLKTFIDLIKKSPNPWKVRKSFKEVFENAGTQSSKTLVKKALKKIFATQGSLEHNIPNEPSRNFN